MTTEMTMSALPKTVNRVTIELIPQHGDTPPFYASWYGETIADGERTWLKLYDPALPKQNDYITMYVEDVADCKVVEMI